MAPPSARRKYIVGLDFGTTFTGISHVDSTKTSINDIQVIRNWPGPSKEYDECWKTPSKIAYANENANHHNLTKGENEIWGYQVEAGMKAYSWMKLRLDQNTRLCEYDDVSLSSLTNKANEGLLRLPEGKTAVEVCTDYLKGIHAYTMSELERTWTSAIIEITPIELWMTVPATWSDEAKGATMVAAKKAGFATRPGDTISMISEPEAAAVATLSGLVAPGIAKQIHAGDGILICDCGGGTVDLTTYIIKSIDPKLEFEELIIGKGGKIGSTYIDRQFHWWLASRFGPYFEKEENLKWIKKGPGSKLMKTFETHKRDFGGHRNRSETYRVPLVLKGQPDSLNYDAEDGEVIFTRADMESFFAPSVTKILELVSDQLTAANKEMKYGRKINMIVLVGGFGDSQYLNDKMQMLCNANGGIRLLVPPHPQAAIVKGAALRGLGNTAPARRRCRRHYGFAFGMVFREGVDPARRAYVDDWDGTKRCSRRMDWRIEKGAYIDTETVVEVECQMNYRKGDPRITKEVLYSCTQERKPDYKDDWSIDKVGVMHFDFSKVPLKLFKMKRSRGEKKHLVSWTYRISMGSQDGVLRVKAFIGNRACGEAEFDFNDTENGLAAASQGKGFIGKYYDSDSD